MSSLFFLEKSICLNSFNSFNSFNSLTPITTKIYITSR